MNEPFTNSLINETSPYLLQHAHNPVNWMPWSEAAFELAQKENKLVLISIGYSSCHWCHVMERESFEDEDTASVMNQHYICIKVDREERPDVDSIYMEAVQLLTGHGGWPLNCFALPDKRPLYGGTYYPRRQWQDVLLKVAALYKDHPDECLQYAEELTKGLHTLEERLFQEKETTALDFQKVYETFQSRFDTREGGMNRAPKFAMPANWQFLLLYYYHSKDKSVLNQVILTLNKMASGGMYDQAGGGFARYSTDVMWKVPHFEKMLYDNAQLVSLYAHAHTVAPSDLYIDVIRETVTFIEREMTDAGGGFYSALDADTEGEEGKYYVWKKEEIENIAGNHAPLALDYFGINEKGYWEHGNYILLRNDTESIAEKHGLKKEELSEIIQSLKIRLLSEREKRIRPGLDDKQICSWNALMIKAYADAGAALNDAAYSDKALQAAEKFVQHFSVDDKLYRIYKSGISRIDGFLDDYAFACNAFIRLYTLSGKEHFLMHAFAWNDYAIRHFYNETSGFFHYTAEDAEKIVTRKTELQDNVIPSSNAVMAENLFLLSHYFAKTEFFEMAERMVNAMHEEIMHHAPWYSKWAEVALMMKQPFYEVVICGKEAKSFAKTIRQTYRPDTLIAFSEKESRLPAFEKRFGDKTQIYVCRNRTCHAPVNTPEEALQLLQ